MSEDPTKDLTTDEILRLILNRLTSVETRLSALEAQAEDRAKTTRPLLNQLIKEMTDTRDTLSAQAERIEASLAEAHKELRSIDRKFDILNKEIFAMKTDIREHAERLAELESRPN